MHDEATRRSDAVPTASRHRGYGMTLCCGWGTEGEVGGTEAARDIQKQLRPRKQSWHSSLQDSREHSAAGVVEANGPSGSQRCERHCTGPVKCSAG
jgi:hypothetical protein